jgi:hypothetical protein
MSAHDEDRTKQLLKQALPPLECDAGPERDLWPDMLRRLDARPAPVSQFKPRWVWFDWAVLAGLAAITVTVPSSIALLLYYI